MGVDVVELFKWGFSVARKGIGLSIINIVLTYIGIDNLARCLAYRGIYVGLKISLPTAIPTLWHFVEVPKGPSVTGILGLFIGMLVAILVSS